MFLSSGRETGQADGSRLSVLSTLHLCVFKAPRVISAIEPQQGIVLSSNPDSHDFGSQKGFPAANYSHVKGSLSVTNKALRPCHVKGK